MLRAIVQFSLRFRGAVLALAVAALGYAVFTLREAKYDVFPDFAPPFVSIQTESPGLSPEQVEALVTQPIENAVNGVTGIASLRSQSIQGLSVISAIFHDNTDVYRDRQLVAERLAALQGELPQGVGAPTITPLSSSTATVLVLGLTSQQLSPMGLRTLADWTLRPKLLAVPGVASVTVFGGDVQQLQIQYDPRKLLQYGLGLNDVLQASTLATGVRGAGFLENANQRLVVQSNGPRPTPTQIAQTVVLHQPNGNVQLGQVATVRLAAAPAFGAASVDGGPGVILNVIAQYGANTEEVTAAVNRALAELQPVMTQNGVQQNDLFQPEHFIRAALSNLERSLLLGGLLVVVVLLLFLYDLRTAAISCLAIPLSLLTATTILEHFGLSLNTMTLGGLAIAIGEVVDDAVIDVENILRRLRQNATAPQRRPAAQVVLAASLEVRSAVVYATFAVAIVFLPILTLSGLAGRIFRPLGIAYVLSILASLLVALTVTPALSLLLLGRRSIRTEEPPLVYAMKRRYRRLLEGVEHSPAMVMTVVVLTTLVGFAALPFFSNVFLPDLQEGHFIVHMSAVPGTSIAESLRIGRQVQKALLALPFVRATGQRVGRASLSDDTWGPHYSEIEVDMRPNGMDSDVAEARLHQTLAQFAGVTFSTETFLSERMQETLSGYNASVVVNIVGNHLGALDQEVGKVADVLRSVPGAADVQLQSPPGMPELTIQLKGDALARWGFAPVTVLDALHTAYQGTVTGEIYQGNRVYSVAVILDPAQRQRMQSVLDMTLRGPSGTYVPLRELANVSEASGRYVIFHDGARRAQVITLNVHGDVAAFVHRAQQELAQKVPLAPGNYIEFSGMAAAQEQARRDLVLYALLAGLGIVLLLSVVLDDWRNLLLVLLNLPFALVGGVLAVFAGGGVLSLGSMVGFVTLFGITLRNSIMLITHYEHLVTVEGHAWDLATAIEGACDRLAPILMTALVTGLGLLPLAIGAGTAGREVEGPLAIVILGGLMTSTTLNLLVLPSLALRYGRFAPPMDGRIGE
ncbi:MAG: efflux RND transporter permease subunit [Acidobacteriaceae bacterium]